MHAHTIIGLCRLFISNIRAEDDFFHVDGRKVAVMNTADKNFRNFVIRNFVIRNFVIRTL